MSVGRDWVCMTKSVSVWRGGRVWFGGMIGGVLIR